MFGRIDSKQQDDRVPSPQDQPEGVIISPDTRRAERIPPGQTRTKKWPVLDASGPPAGLTEDDWRLKVVGLVETPVEWDITAFRALPRVKVFADMHCVTRWSRLGNLWEGVSVREILSHVTLKPQATHVLVYGYDRAYGRQWSTNLPLEEFAAEDCLFADTHDGEPIDEEHGGPVRLVVPGLYAWKSAKWVAGIELMQGDRPGFWESGGYHMHGDPWKEERFRSNW
jgi:DMSO/TMAO reductase YedYZ molybdopterin-dependent catalytic subunit